MFSDIIKMFSKHSKPGTSSKEFAAAKRKHVTLSLQQKLDIITRLEKGENRNSIMSEFNIGSSTIYDIKKQKDKLREFVAQSVTSKSIDTRQTLKKPKLDQLDSVLYTWFSVKRSEGKPVTGPMLIEKAKQFQREMNLPVGDCVFSDGWLRNFKIRHGIRRLDVSGETRSADNDSAVEYKDTFESIVTEHALSPSQIYNADETGLLWRCLPASTLAGAEEKCAKGFKHNKDRLTVLLCSNASGDHQCTPFVVGKYKKPRAFKGLTNLPVHYDAQRSAWMTAELFKYWFFHLFVPQVKNNFKELNLPEESKAVLLLDNCRAHPPASELVSGQIFATFLPANVTSLIQPLDQGVIQNFKSFYRSSFIQSLLNSDCSVMEFQKKFNIKDAVFATALAWSQVKKVTLQRSWRKLWPCAATVDEEENAITDSCSEVLDTIKDAPSDNPLNSLSQDEMMEWVDIDKDEAIVEELTDEAIIQSVLNPQTAKEVESDDEEGETSNQVTWSEASSALTTFINFAESSRLYNTAEVMNLHILRNNFFKKRAESRKQKDIRDYL